MSVVETRTCATCSRPSENRLCLECDRVRRQAYRDRDRKNPGLRSERRQRRMEQAKLKKSQATEQEIEEKAFSASIPVAVFRPYLEIALRQCSLYESAGGLGYSTLAGWTDVDERVFSRIMSESEEVYAISIDAVDRVCQKFDFTLDELTHRAFEWAELTGDPWPFGYR